MICVIDYDVQHADSDFRLTAWLSMNGVSYYRMSPGSHLPEKVSRIMISGGPRHSSECDDTIRIIQQYQVPIFGVCLGCMCIVRAFGGELRDCDQAVSPMETTKRSVEWLRGFPNQSEVTVAHREKIVSIGSGLEADIFGPKSEVLGVAAMDRPVFGVMFHPESSISSRSAQVILTNFMKL